MNKVHTGQNSKKEEFLREKWESLDHGTIRINTPRTVVDRGGRIMAWILPEALLPELQVYPPLTVSRNVSLTIVFEARAFRFGEGY